MFLTIVCVVISWFAVGLVAYVMGHVEGYNKGCHDSLYMFDKDEK